MTQIKTDNTHLETKLALRRYFLDRYHAGHRFRVLDCCQGKGATWGRLCSEYECDYWGVDQKRRAGRLKIDSARILAQPGWEFDVIDIDTYGSPWRHWLALLANIRRPATVFLTIGDAGMVIDKPCRDALFLGGLKIPEAILYQLRKIAITSLLTRGCEHAILGEVAEGFPSDRTRYIGVRLEAA